MKSFKEENLLNKRSELSNKCRNQNKFTLTFSLKYFLQYPHRGPHIIFKTKIKQLKIDVSLENISENICYEYGI